MASKNVIEQVSQKREDGSFSQPYLFGVHGENVTLKEGDDLETRLLDLKDFFSRFLDRLSIINVDEDGNEQTFVIDTRYLVDQPNEMLIPIRGAEKRFEVYEAQKTLEITDHYILDGDTLILFHDYEGKPYISNDN